MCFRTNTLATLNRARLRIQDGLEERSWQDVEIHVISMRKFDLIQKYHE